MIRKLFHNLSDDNKDSQELYEIDMYTPED